MIKNVKNYQPSLSTKKNISPFALIIIIALSSRIIFFVNVLDYKAVPQQNFSLLLLDSSDYHSLAKNIIQNKNFVPPGIYSRSFNPITGLELSAKRTPGYPLFVALSYLIFGIKFWPVYLIQIILDTLTVIITYLISRELFKSKTPAFIAAFLYSINPLAIYFASALLSEILFTFIFSLSILMFIRALKSAKVKKFILVGFLLGISTLIRPIALYSPLIMLFILLLKDKNFPLRLRTIASLFMLAAFLITISPWQYRNFKTFGHYSLTTQGGTNLCFWNARILKENLEGLSEEKAASQLVGISANNVDNPFEKEKIYRKIGLKYISKYPFQYAYYHVKGLWQILTHTLIPNKNVTLLEKRHRLPKDSLINTIKPFLKIKIILENFFLMLGLIFLCLKENRKYILLFFMLIFYLLNITSILGLVISATLRFKIPLLPFLVIVTAQGITGGVKFIFKKPNLDI